MEDRVVEWPKRPNLKKTKKPTATPVPDSTAGKGIGRRKILKAVIGGAAAAVTYAVAKKGSLDFLSSDSDSQSGENVSILAKNEPELDFDARVSKNIRTIISKDFGHLTQEEFDRAVKTTQDMVKVITNNPSYNEMLAVTKKHAKQIKEEANSQNFPQDLVIGVIFIENGGGEDLESPAGGVGVGQFLKHVAIEYGLRVDEEVDERKDPVKSIPAILKKLKNDTEIFGGKPDIGTWLYHAGLGNGYKALQIHYRHATDVDLGDITEMETPEAIKLRNTFNQLVRQDDLSVHTILQDEAVRTELIANLEDETELYPYKAVAAAALFKVNTAND